MEQLLFQGNTKFNGKQGVGAIVLTDEQIYFFKKSMMSVATQGMFGLIGVLVTYLIEKTSAKNNPQSFQTDPNFMQLEESLRGKVATMKEMKVVAVADISQVRETRVGYEFALHNGQILTFQGLIHKKKILAWLQQRGLSVVER